MPFESVCTLHQTLASENSCHRVSFQDVLKCQEHMMTHSWHHNPETWNQDNVDRRPKWFLMSSSLFWSHDQWRLMNLLHLRSHELFSQVQLKLKLQPHVLQLLSLSIITRYRQHTQYTNKNQVHNHLSQFVHHEHMFQWIWHVQLWQSKAEAMQELHHADHWVPFQAHYRSLLPIENWLTIAFSTQHEHPIPTDECVIKITSPQSRSSRRCQALGTHFQWKALDCWNQGIVLSSAKTFCNY